jgi:cytochrome c oxidase assembly protein subunit 15
LFAGVGSVWVFVLVTLGAFTTSIGAGMAFPDWPLSNGSINPEGWLSDISMFAEHSHRLTGMMMGFITIGLAIWLWRTEHRALVAPPRVLGARHRGAAGRDRRKARHSQRDRRALLHMSLGEMLRIPHGILAQVYVCLLIGIAAGCSRSWIERGSPVGAAVRQVGDRVSRADVRATHDRRDHAAQRRRPRDPDLSLLDPAAGESAGCRRSGISAWRFISPIA